MIAILNIIFFIFIGLEYLGVKFQYQDLLIGISALIIGVMALISFVQSRG